jgi:hypothetical protein
MLLALIVLPVMKIPDAHALIDKELGRELDQEEETLNKLLQEADKFVNESLDVPDFGTPSATLRAENPVLVSLIFFYPFCTSNSWRSIVVLRQESERVTSHWFKR